MGGGGLGGQYGRSYVRFSGQCGQPFVINPAHETSLVTRPVQAEQEKVFAGLGFDGQSRVAPANEPSVLQGACFLAVPEHLDLVAAGQIDDLPAGLGHLHGRGKISHRRLNIHLRHGILEINNVGL